MIHPVFLGFTGVGEIAGDPCLSALPVMQQAARLTSHRGAATGNFGIDPVPTLRRAQWLPSPEAKPRSRASRSSPIALALTFAGIAVAASLLSEIHRRITATTAI